MKKILPLFILTFAANMLFAVDETQRNPPCETPPNESGTCEECDTPLDANDCVKITVPAGQTAAWADGREVQLKVFSQHASPELFTPSQLRVVMGYTFQHLGSDRTSKGAPAEVVFCRSSGAAIHFRFAEGASWGIPDPGVHKELPERLMMVDAEGWATLKDPVYYDLYPGDGSRWRFLATDRTQALGELIESLDSRGRRLTQADLGVEIIRDSAGNLAQLLTANRLADVTLLPEDPLITGYTVRVYPIQTSPEFDPATGRFIIPNDASPETILTIQNGTKEHNGQTVKDIHTLYSDRKKGGGATLRHTFTYINGDWTLLKPDGTVSQKEIYYGDDDQAELTSKTFAPDGTLLAQKISHFESFAWGLGMTNQIEGLGETTRTARWHYFTTGTSKGKVSRMENSTGYWETYQYDDQGRRTRTESPLSGMPDHPNATKVITTSYTPHDPRDPLLLNDTRPRLITETIAGIETKRTYYAYPTNSLGVHFSIEERCSKAGESYGAGENLRVVSAWYSPSASSLLAGRFASFQSETGDITHYGYCFGNYESATATFRTDSEGSYWCETVTRLHISNTAPGSVGTYEIYQPNDSSIQIKAIPFKTTRSRVVFNTAGEKVFESDELLCEDNFWRTVHFKKYFLATDGKVIRTESDNGLTTETEWGQNCCGKSAYTDERGIRSTYQYDVNGRLTVQTVLDPVPVESHFIYDALGRQTASFTTNRIARLGTPLLKTRYDALGRVIAQTDRLGNTTRIVYSPDESTATLFYPQGAERTVNFLHGRTLSVLESETTPEVYTYGPAWIKVSKGAQWKKITYNLLRQVIREEQSTQNGAIRVTRHAYDLHGRLVKTETDSAPTLTYLYNQAGEQIGRVRSDGTVFRKRTSENYYTFEQNQIWLVEHVIDSWSDSAIAPVSKKTYHQLSGLTQSTPEYKFAIDTRGNRLEAWTTVDPVTKIWTSHKKYPHASTVETTDTRHGQVFRTVDVTSVTNSVIYDGLGRPFAQIDGRGNRHTRAYNAFGQVVTDSDSGNRTTTYGYDAWGRLSAITNALGHSTRYTYDLRGNRIREAGNATHPIAYEYDGFGRRIAMTTWRNLENTGDTTRWNHDEASGFLLSKTYPDGTSYRYTYTDSGAPLTVTDPRGIVTSYQFDSWGEVLKRSYSDSTPPTSFSYNARGQLLSAVRSGNTTHFTYDVYGKPLSEQITGDYTKTVTHHTDSFGRSAGYSIDNTRNTGLAYDSASGRLASMTTPDGAFTWAWTPGTRSLKASLTYPDATVSRFDYESDRNLTASITLTQADSLLSHYAYRYTPLGQRAENAFSVPPLSLADTIHYSENTRGEIIKAHAQSNQSYSYDFEFDHAGNRVRASENGAETPYAVNALNQYTQIDGFTPGFDAAGNQTRIKTITGVWEVKYDADNRPVRWIQGSTSIIMDYDYLGRRIRYRSLKEGIAQSDKHFVYNGDVCVEQLSTVSNAVEAAFTWDPAEPSATRPLSFSRPGETTLFYAHDANKNVSELFNASLPGIVTTHYAYAPFGELVRKAGADVPNPFRFSSEFYDEELGLVYFNYRHYDPLSGRWLSRDPLGEDLAENLYWMNRNDAVNAWDELGLASSTKSECEEKLKKWDNNIGNLGKIKKRIIDGKCPSPKISCDCCKKYSGFESQGYNVTTNQTYSTKMENGVLKYYDFKDVITSNEYSQITMCYNNLPNSDEEYKTILEHEYLHALQRCTKKSDKDNLCEQSICKEIEAYYTADCKTAKDRKACTKGRYKGSSYDACETDFNFLNPERDEKGKKKKLKSEDINKKMDGIFEDLFDSCSKMNGV